MVSSASAILVASPSLFSKPYNTGGGEQQEGLSHASTAHQNTCKADQLESAADWAADRAVTPSARSTHLHYILQIQIQGATQHALQLLVQMLIGLAEQRCCLILCRSWGLGVGGVGGGGWVCGVGGAPFAYAAHHHNTRHRASAHQTRCLEASCGIIVLLSPPGLAGTALAAAAAAAAAAAWRPLLPRRGRAAGAGVALFTASAVCLTSAFFMLRMSCRARRSKSRRDVI